MDRNTKLKACVLAASSLALIAVAGCDKPNPAESAGKQIDQSMQKMGQRVDQATDRAKEQVAQTADRAKEQVAKTGQVLDDTAITAAVKAGIIAEPGLKVLKIDVDTKNGQVTLTGSVDSAENVQRATQVASSVQGVKGVDNRLAVSSKS
jgi:hyperosmotically inducible periplasmic protein